MATEADLDKIRALLDEDRGGLQKNVDLAFRIANEVPGLLDLVDRLQASPGEVARLIFDEVGVAIAGVEASAFEEGATAAQGARAALRAIAKLRLKWVDGATL